MVTIHFLSREETGIPRRGPVARRLPHLPAALCILLLAAPAMAARPGFHAGGVGTCEQCHVMHDAASGQIALDGTRPLLLAESSTDLCLTCHGPTGVFGLDPLAPPRELGAGNFVFLLENNLNDAAGGVLAPIAGEAAGHSIVSLSRGTMPDTRWSTAPGGTFPSSALGCTSCHDPHGNRSFRMLRGVGPVQGGVATFVYPAPTAVGLDTTDPKVRETRTTHTAYQAGMSQWCANCHGLYHQEAGGSFEHPVHVALGTGERRRYERYEGDAAPLTGIAADSYIAEVPFEDRLAATNSTAGPTAASRLNCLTCHRAHASSAPASGRWDFSVYRLDQDGVVSGSYPLPNPYPGVEQGQLCGKCHGQRHDQGRVCLACHGGSTRTIFPSAP